MRFRLLRMFAKAFSKEFERPMITNIASHGSKEEWNRTRNGKTIDVDFCDDLGTHLAPHRFRRTRRCSPICRDVLPAVSADSPSLRSNPIRSLLRCACSRRTRARPNCYHFPLPGRPQPPGRTLRRLPDPIGRTNRRRPSFRSLRSNCFAWLAPWANHDEFFRATAAVRAPFRCTRVRASSVRSVWFEPNRPVCRTVPALRPGCILFECKKRRSLKLLSGLMRAENRKEKPLPSSANMGAKLWMLSCVSFGNLSFHLSNASMLIGLITWSVDRSKLLRFPQFKIEAKNVISCLTF